MANLKNYKDDPVAQFEDWFRTMQSHPIRRIVYAILRIAGKGVAEVATGIATSLATATKDGKPSNRMVLFRGIRDGGFLFYTNYESQKGQELSENPRAAMTFFWMLPFPPWQVRIEGTVKQIDVGLSDLDWKNKPRQNQLVSYASSQSKKISEKALMEHVAVLTKEFDGKPVPRPPHWGGYILMPTRVEFWKARTDRFFDRVNYDRNADGKWDRSELAP